MKNTMSTQHDAKLPVKRNAEYHAKQIVKQLTMRPHLTNDEGCYDMYNDEIQMIEIVSKYLSKHFA